MQMAAPCAQCQVAPCRALSQVLPAVSRLTGLQLRCLLLSRASHFMRRLHSADTVRGQRSAGRSGPHAGAASCSTGAYGGQPRLACFAACMRADSFHSSAVLHSRRLLRCTVPCLMLSLCWLLLHSFEAPCAPAGPTPRFAIGDVCPCSAANHQRESAQHPDALTTTQP